MIRVIISSRLTPTYGFVILFFVYLLPLVGKGPIWSTASVKTMAKPCDDYWWTNILYINNFYPTKLGKEVFSLSFSLKTCVFYISSPFVFV